ncbi:MAG: TolC family protein [Candidatus Margulisiibacteriota bacterium]
MRGFVGVCLAVIAIPACVMAHELTVDQAIAEAKIQSPILQKAEATLAQAKWQKEVQWGQAYLPKLSANAGHVLGHEYEVLDVPFGGETVSFPSIYPTTVYGLKASLPLFDGFANGAAVEAAEQTVVAAQQAVDHVRFRVEESVRLAFYKALTAHDMQAVTTHHVEALQEQFKQVQNQKRGGRATDYDVLRVQVKLSEATLEAADAKDAVATARQTVTQLLGKTTDDRTLVGALPTPDIKMVDALVFDPTLRARSDLNALAARKQALEKAEGTQKPWYLPELSAVGSYDAYNNRNSAVFGDGFRTAYQTALVAHWTLFDGQVGLAKVQALKAQEIELDSEIQAAKLAAYADFDRWKKTFKSNVLRFQVKTLDAKRSQESVRLVKLEALAGTRTQTEVLDARLDLFLSDAGKLKAQMNAVEALINLEMILGRRL